MQRDIRTNPLYIEAQSVAREMAQPGTGTIVDAQELHARPDGVYAAFCATVFDVLEGTPPTRIATIDVATGQTVVRTSGPGRDRMPRWSPDGETIAFLSDRERPGDFQIYLLDARSWQVRHAPKVPGFVESIEWAADGYRLLARVAGTGADTAGAQGGIGLNICAESLPAWMPTVDTGPSENQWRRAWLVDLVSGIASRISPLGTNVWECCWCGAHAIAAIGSNSPDEAAWYNTTVMRIDVTGGAVQTLFTSAKQLEWLASSPSGSHVAVVEAFCSDRTVVAGDIVLLGEGGKSQKLLIGGVDVSKLAFASETELLFAGHRSFETVLGTLNIGSADRVGCKVLWQASDCTFGAFRCPDFAVLPGQRVLATVEAFNRRPAICILSASNCTAPVRALGHDALEAKVSALVGGVEAVRWAAPDGLEIHGWLVLPKKRGSSPPPLVMDIHGGPVWQWRQRWIGHHLARMLLLERGYAVFLPNPRGSSGRGQAFAERVLGDMGGADTHDYLSGLDFLVGQGLADPHNLFVYGVSYGGFMSSWLVTQDPRFAAAAPISPVSNWYSEHLSCHIPVFCEMFLGQSMLEPGGNYFKRSPIFQAQRVSTPCLNITGALDKNTPPGQAVEFHHALLANGVESALVIYPTEGHGIRGQYPAMSDMAARVVAWFESHRRQPNRGNT